MKRLAQRLRDDLNAKSFVLLYAYNGTGKTRLSMEFKEQGKNKRKENGRDTLYFNAFTEDLFSWDNDLLGDSERKLKINSESSFFSGLKDLSLEERIGKYLERYTDINFKIDYEDWHVGFYKEDSDYIKVSRGEENIFIWCVFLSICQLVIEKHEAYAWVKYLYVDDPISSLDDNNAIAVASDLAQLLKTSKEHLKVVISSHHGLFFNIICNELKNEQHTKYFFYRRGKELYSLQATEDTPFLNHVSMLCELQKASESGELYTYHFNMLRSILEKTSTFFGHDDFSFCIHGVEDQVLYARALNLLSHGKYSIYEPKEMVADTKELFNKILSAFLDRYKFNLPEIFNSKPKEGEA
jgi:hypothetical protein